jgi:hypothetical protein
MLRRSQDALTDEPVADYVLTSHARQQMARRGLSEETVHLVLTAPEQRLEIRPGRVVMQSRVRTGTPERTYLVRVFVDTTSPPEVVTLYRTSRVAKDWRNQSWRNQS